MLIFIFAILLIIIGGLSVVSGVAMNRGETGRFKPGDDFIGGGFILAIGAFVLLVIPSLFVTGTQQGHANNVQNSRYVVEELSRQRDALSEVFADVLAADEFVVLMEASVPEDVKFLKTTPGVDTFLLGRADRIVAINAKLFEERNGILDEARGVCNTVQNWFIPQIPGIVDCQLDELENLYMPISEEG